MTHKNKKSVFENLTTCFGKKLFYVCAYKEGYLVSFLQFDQEAFKTGLILMLNNFEEKCIYSKFLKF